MQTGFLDGLSAEQLQIINSLVSGLLGAGSAMGVQWMATRKSRDKKKEEHTEAINKAAVENVQASQVLIDMLQDMLNQQRDYYEQHIAKITKSFEVQIESAKTSCSEQVHELSRTIDSLTEKVAIMNEENKQLSHEIVGLSFDKKAQRNQIERLTLKVAAYEDIRDIEKIKKDETVHDVILNDESIDKIMSEDNEDELNG